MSAPLAIVVSCDKGKDERGETRGTSRSESSLEESTKKPAATTILHMNSVLGGRVIKTSLKRGSDEAKFVEKDRTYQLRPDSISTYPFSAVTYMIPNGPHKGRQAPVLDPVPLKKRRLDFMEFPGEIRNRIYGCALLEADFENANHTISIHQLGKQLRVSKQDLLITTGLLQVSKQVNKEAATILYGFGAFWFTDTTALSHFLSTIGKRNCSYLTNVTIRTNVFGDIKPASKLLQYATLRHLQLNIHSWYRFLYQHGRRVPSMDDFVRDFLPVLTAIHLTRGSTPFFAIVKMAKTALPGCHTYEYLDWDDPRRGADDEKPVCKHDGCRKLRDVMSAFKEALRKRNISFKTEAREEITTATVKAVD